MQYKAIYYVIPVLLLTTVAGQAIAQPANKPAVTTQVPAPSVTVAPTPGIYGTIGQTPMVNYVRERDGLGRITDANIFDNAAYTDVKQTTQYLDGLGRPVQTVIRQATPGATPKDLVSPVLYDAFGRETYKYLPYAPTTGVTDDGSFRQDAFTDQKNFYQNIYPSEQPAYTGEQVFYGQTNFEPSPLNRVLQTLSPGNSWAGSGVGTSMQYQVNTDADNVAIWTISSDALTYSNNDISTNIPVSSANYPAGQLYKTVTTDEQGHAMVEYKDKDGLVILKKVQSGTVPADYSGYDGWLSTYYIYDHLNQLRFVLSPKATGIAYGNSWDLNTDPTTINELCFRYEYDERGRIIAKKLPGAGWVYTVYDRRDRSVFSQDANMLVASHWMATLYDGLNRPTLTGMITYTGTRDQLQQYVYDNTGNGISGPVTVAGTTPATLPSNLSVTGQQTGTFEATEVVTLTEGFGTPVGADFLADIVPATANSFSNTVQAIDNPLPAGNGLIALTMTFYDDYGNTSDRSYSTTYNTLLDAGTSLHPEDLPTASVQQAVMNTGLVTGTMVRVIEDPSDLSKGSWLTTVNFYDDRARLVQTQADNYRGGQDIAVSRYNFTGQVISSYLSHNNPIATSNKNTRVKTNFNYDVALRLLQVYKTINDDATTKRLVAQHDYDQLGQLKQKQIGQLPDNSFLETQDFSYNIRGWLKGINRDYANNDNSHGANNRWFGIDLSYDWGFGNNQLNGNIAGAKWRSKGDDKQRAYGYGYDPVNRLLYADFNQYSSGNWDKSAGINFTTFMGNGVDPAQAYDANGNILAMQQMGWKLGGNNAPIDQLTYNYKTNSNGLKNVIDGQNDPLTTLGDFRTSSLSPYSTNKTDQAVDYSYDYNGNLTRDLNKDIGSSTTDGIVYNHLNLPWQITVRSATGTKGTITYIYDAAGTKLKKTTSDQAGNMQTVTTYIDGFQYQGTQPATAGSSDVPAETLQFLAHEEGKIRVSTNVSSGQPVTAFNYDYFIKDYLNNTRVVLTDEKQTDLYPAATMESANSTTEGLYYSGLDNTRTTLPAGYPTDQTTNPNNYVARLNGGTAGPKIGPGITLKVMAGDQFNIKASSWYRLNGTTPGTPASPLSDLLTALISGIGGIPGGGHPAQAVLQSNSGTIGTGASQFLTTTGAGSQQSKPQAFVNWILFDNQFNYVSASSGFDQVGGDQEFKIHTLLNLPVTQSGYLYIYTSNETPNVDVFFDNLQVTHVRGPMLEETHYYPFGLTMAGISDKAMKSQYAQNKYRYTGKELQNQEFSDGSGLEWYDVGKRMLDPQLGRWHVLDPKADLLEMSSPYVFCYNNPNSYKDPDGELAILINGLTSSDDERGTQKYWASGLLQAIEQSGIPYSNDRDRFRYVDGNRYDARTSNDYAPDIQNGSAFAGNSAMARRDAGYEVGSKDVKDIISKLAKDPKSGKIIEKIEIYTHSRGTAFGAGYAEALMDYISQNKELFADPDYEIDLGFNMAPNEASRTGTNAAKGVDTYSINHGEDPLSSPFQSGTIANFHSSERVNAGFGSAIGIGFHATGSFVKDVKEFTKAFTGAKGDSKKLIQNFVSNMKRNYGIEVKVIQ
jgi:RHS repeat-associated protein